MQLRSCKVNGINCIERRKKLVEIEDLSNVFRVQLGIFTQKFNLNWFIKQNHNLKLKQKKKLL